MGLIAVSSTLGYSVVKQKKTNANLTKTVNKLKQDCSLQKDSFEENISKNENTIAILNAELDGLSILVMKAKIRYIGQFIRPVSE